MASTPVEDTINTTNCNLWTLGEGEGGEEREETGLSLHGNGGSTLQGETHLYLNEVDRLQEAWLGSQHAGVDDTSSGGYDLATSSVNGICMECDVMDVESN